MLRLPVLALLAIAACKSPDAGLRPALDYRVLAETGGRTLHVEGSFRDLRSDRLVAGMDAASHVREARALVDGQWRPLAREEQTFLIPRIDPLEIRYDFDLAGAASELRENASAAAHGDVLVAPPSTWLLRPAEVTTGSRALVTVSCPEGTQFVSGVRLADASPDDLVIDAEDLGQLPYSAFGSFRRQSIEVRGGRVEVAIADGPLALDDAAVGRWVGDAARAVSDYFGTFPVLRALLIVLPVAGGEEVSGSTMGGGGAATVLHVPLDLRAVDLTSDWVLTHEMIHLALPTLPRANLWLAEGIATYVEPLVRARAGAIESKRVWLDLMHGLPNGMPRRRDEGLDHTVTWGRTYWGGALYCLLADLEIRERTDNRRSLDDALRGILAAGGNLAASWDIERVLRAGDAATQTTVLADLHREMADRPMRPDLDRIWQRLGIARRGRRIEFDEQAPLAAIRRSITEVKG